MRIKSLMTFFFKNTKAYVQKILTAHDLKCKKKVVTKDAVQVLIE